MFIDPATTHVRHARTVNTVWKLPGLVTFKPQRAAVKGFKSVRAEVALGALFVPSACCKHPQKVCGLALGEETREDSAFE